MSMKPCYAASRHDGTRRCTLPRGQFMPAKLARRLFLDGNIYTLLEAKPVVCSEIRVLAKRGGTRK